MCDSDTTTTMQQRCLSCGLMRRLCALCALNRAKIVTMHVPAELAVHDFIYISKPHPEKTILELKDLYASLQEIEQEQLLGRNEIYNICHLLRE